MTDAQIDAANLIALVDGLEYFDSGTMGIDDVVTLMTADQTVYQIDPDGTIRVMEKA